MSIRSTVSCLHGPERLIRKSEIPATEFEITLASIYTSPILMMKNSLENTGFLLVHLMTIDAQTLLP